MFRETTSVIGIGNRHRFQESKSTITYRFSVPVTSVTFGQNWWNGEPGAEMGNRHWFQESESGSTITINSRFRLLLTRTFEIKNRERTTTTSQLVRQQLTYRNNATPQQVRFSNVVLI